MFDIYIQWQCCIPIAHFWSSDNNGTNQTSVQIGHRVHMAVVYEQTQSGNKTIVWPYKPIKLWINLVQLDYSKRRRKCFFKNKKISLQSYLADSGTVQT